MTYPGEHAGEKRSAGAKITCSTCANSPLHDPKCPCEITDPHEANRESAARLPPLSPDGNVYTKEADLLADLAGKKQLGLNAGDYRNPACIAGMGAELFGSSAKITCAATLQPENFNSKLKLNSTKNP